MKSIFNRESTVADVLQGIRLDGKLAIVTGGASGLGRETVLGLASVGCRVIIAARNQSAAESEATQINHTLGAAHVSVMPLDLLSLESVRKFAAQFSELYSSLDILINNAGVMACPLVHSVDNHESQFQSNFLSHYLLTRLLMPLLVRSNAGRVITLTSSAHQIAPANLDDPDFNQNPYERWLAYAQSKTADIHLAVGVHHRFNEQGVLSFAVHPGFIETPLMRYQSEEDLQFTKGLFGDEADLGSLYKTAQQGAATSVWAATSPSLINDSSAYLQDCGVAEVIHQANYVQGVMSYALEESTATRLWQLAAEMVGLPEADTQ